MIIAISGTPGTGKHTIAKILAKEMKYKVLDLNPVLNSGKKEKEVTLKEVFTKYFRLLGGVYRI